MAYTEADLTRVRTALLRGEKTVEFADRSVTYRSVSELQQVEQAILAEMRSASSARRPKRVYGVMSGRGF